MREISETHWYFLLLPITTPKQPFLNPRLWRWGQLDHLDGVGLISTMITYMGSAWSWSPRWGWRGALQGMAALCLSSTLCGAAMLPPPLGDRYHHNWCIIIIMMGIIHLILIQFLGNFMKLACFQIAQTRPGGQRGLMIEKRLKHQPGWNIVHCTYILYIVQTCVHIPHKNIRHDTHDNHAGVEDGEWLSPTLLDLDWRLPLICHFSLWWRQCPQMIFWQ